MPYRVSLTEPGQALIEPTGLLESARRFQEFTISTGLAPDDCVTTPIVAVPMPFYPASWPGGRKRWEGIKPDAMWHPLMWLPEQISQRYLILREDGSSSIESDECWAVRVAIEMEITGLYEAETGAWVDVLDRVGLDTGSPEDLARIQRWLEGESDELLDAVTLEHIADPDWAIQVAIELEPALNAIAKPLIATDLTDLFDTCRGGLTGAGSPEPGPGQVESAADTCDALAGLAASYLAHASPRALDPIWWRDWRPRWDGTAPGLARILSECAEAATDSVEGYQDRIEELARSGEDIASTLAELEALAL